MLFSHSLSFIFPLDPHVVLSSLSPLYSSSVFSCCSPLEATDLSVLRFFLHVQREYTDANANMHISVYTFRLYLPYVYFFAEYTDKLDIFSLFQIVFHTHAGISMRTTEKAKNPPGSSFLLPVCVHLSLRSPRLPLGTSQHLFYWPLLCVREQIGFYSQVRVEDKCERSITFCIRMELSGCEWLCLFLSIDAGYLTVCECVEKSYRNILYLLVCTQEN